MSSPWSWKPGPPPFADSSPHQAHSTNSWHRDVWPGELTFAIGKVASPGLMDVLISCQISAAAASLLTPEVVRNATRRLRWHHPAIAFNVAFPRMTSIDDFKPFEGVFTYQAPADEKEVDEWLDEVVHDRSTYIHGGRSMTEAVRVVREELGAFDKERTKWMFEVYHISHPSQQEHAVILHLGHALFDGMGAVQVLDLWLNELAHVSTEHGKAPFRWGQEFDRLPDAMPERTEIPWTGAPTPPNHLILRKVRDALQRPPPNVKLPVLNPDAEPTLSGNIVKSFAPGFAEKLRLAARAHGCGLFSVVFAANSLTLLHLPPRTNLPEGELFVHIYPAGADLRSKHLIGGAKAQKHRRNWQIGLVLGGSVVGAYHLERFLYSDRLQNVWTLAKEVQAQVLEQQPYQASASQWVPAIIEAMLTKYSTDYVPEVRDLRSVNVSSLGVLDGYLEKTYDHSKNSHFTISDLIISSIGPTLTSDGVGVLLVPYTWDGMFRISFSYATAYMGTDEEQAAAEKEGRVTLRLYVEQFCKLLERIAESRILELETAML